MLRLNISILFILTSHLCLSQEYGYKYIAPQYELEHINLNSKEDISPIGDVEEDNQGYIWLATGFGLGVYDGHKLTSYKNTDKKFGLRNNTVVKQINRLTFLQDSTFWFLEDMTHLSLYDPKKRKVIDTISPKMLNNEQIHFLKLSIDDILYIKTVNYTTNTSSIWRKTRDGKLVEVFKMEKDFSKLNNTYELVNNDHWIIEEERLTRYSLDGKTKLVFDVSCDATNFLRWQDQGCFFYYNKSNHTIFKWNEHNGTFDAYFKLPNSLIGKGKYYYLRKDDLFLGDNLSLYYVNLKDKTIQDLSNHFLDLVKKVSPNSLGVSFEKYFERRDGTVLLCNQKDIYLLKKKVPTREQFLEKVEAKNKTLPLLSFRALAEDDKKNIYASYYTGIVKKMAGTNKFIPFDIPKTIIGNPISTYSLNYWKGHLLWNNINFNLNSGTYSYIGENNFGQHCTQYLSNDTLWLFKWYTNILYYYDLKSEKLSTHILDNNISNKNGMLNEMNDMIGDATGQNLWISTTNHGLLLISKKGKLIKKFTSKDLGITDENVTNLQLVGDLLWFGCKDGLGVLHIPSLKTTIYKNPTINSNGIIQNRMMYSILPDDEGNFLLGSSIGLLKFNLKSKEFFNLVEGHPLSNIEFNRASSFKDSNGRYYFGTTDGLYSFLANELEFIKSSSSLRPIKLLAASIYNGNKSVYTYFTKDIDNLKSLKLGPYDNNVEIEVSLPEYTNDIYYSYRIKGQNDSWSDYKKDNSIPLNGINPGSYTLEIKASSSFDDKDAVYYSLAIEKSQLWYKRNWVMALFLLSGLCVLIALIRYRYNLKINRQKEMEALRNKISSDLHDDVGSILSGLSMQSQLLTMNAEGDQKESLISISDMSKDAMERMRDTVWAIDSRKDTNGNLIDRMRAFAEQQLHLKNINHVFHIEGINDTESVAPNIRQNLYLIFKEAITNVVKHSNASTVNISFTKEKNNFKLTIHDNGSLNHVKNTDGNGLTNMVQRAKNVNGTINIDKSNGYKIELIY